MDNFNEKQTRELKIDKALEKVGWKKEYIKEEDNSLRGEERRVVSTKLYRSEFVNFLKICEAERKSVNGKLREMVRKEINEKLGGVLKDE